MAGAGKLEIDIEVRLDKLDEGLSSVEKKVTETGRRVESAGGKFESMANTMGTVTRAATKIVAAVGVIDAGIKGATAQAHALKGAWALVKGDTQGALNALEDYGNSIRSLPIVGGIVGGIADSLYNLADAIGGMSEQQAKLDKQLSKERSEESAARSARQIQAGNKLLTQQIAILEERNEIQKAGLTYGMQVVQLDQKEKILKAAVTDSLNKGSKAQKTALDQIAKQIGLEKEVLRIKHEQAKEETLLALERDHNAKAAENAAKWARGDKQVEIASQTVGSLRDQLQIASAQSEQEKLRLTFLSKARDIAIEFQNNQDAILKNDDLNGDQKRKLIDILKEEKSIKTDLVDLAIDAQEKALRESEQQKKRSEELKKQTEILKEQDALDKKRMGQLGKRLGLASKVDAPTKSGFTSTGNTAMGSFTFADNNAEDQIKALQKEQVDIQKQMDLRLQAIEGFAKQLVANMGF
tara:strand:- start:7595 stop:8998 length:1404 start_codon:yes stop_codon:yes gene_type:complete